MNIPLDVKRRVIEADARVAKLESLLGKWVDYCGFAGVQPVSGNLEDNPVLTLLRDSREALKVTTHD
jgi:hypothetical protein